MGAPVFTDIGGEGGEGAIYLLERLSATETSLSTPAVGRIATYTIEPALTPSRKLPATVSPTIASTSSPTSTSSAVSTHTATPASTPVPTSTAMSTGTPAPTETFTPTATPTPEPLTSYELLIATRGEDSLFVVNQTTKAFPLAPLRLSDGEGVIDVPEWGIEMLESKECVTAWKDGGKPRPPEELECERVGERLIRSRRDILWKNAFTVFSTSNKSAFAWQNPRNVLSAFL